jgi:hypothetical protein
MTHSMHYKDILALIETVAPDDTAKLDEIDARVHCYLGNMTFTDMLPPDFGDSPVYLAKSSETCHVRISGSSKYTRSRDALKAIRPKGWAFDICDYGHGAFVELRKLEPSLFENLMPLPTEELAELHAIIQAVEWERTNGQ